MERLERVAAFVAQLHRLSLNSPRSWRRDERVGRDIHAGLIHRRTDDTELVLLTDQGRDVAAAGR